MEAGLHGDVGEEGVALVVVEGRGVLPEVGDQQLGIAVAVGVAGGEPHAALGVALAVERRAAPQADLGEVAVAVVLVEVVGVRVVGDVEVEVEVAVDVEGRHAEAVVAADVGQARFAGGVAEAAAPLVLEVAVGLALESERPQHHPQPLPVEAEGGAEDVVHGGVDVAGDEEVLVAVAVGVEEDGAGRPAVEAGHAGGARDAALEGAVAAVEVEDVGAEVTDEEVRPPVAVGVAHRHPVAPAVVTHPGGVGHVLERAVAPVAVEAVAPPLDDAAPLQPPGVDQVEVEVAVPVDVDQPQPAAARLEDVRLLRPPAPGGGGEPGRGGDVDEVEAGLRRRGDGRETPRRGARGRSAPAAGAERRTPPNAEIRRIRSGRGAIAETGTSAAEDSRAPAGGPRCPFSDRRSGLCHFRAATDTSFSRQRRRRMRPGRHDRGAAGMRLHRSWLYRVHQPERRFLHHGSDRLLALGPKPDPIPALIRRSRVSRAAIALGAASLSLSCRSDAGLGPWHRRRTVRLEAGRRDRAAARSGPGQRRALARRRDGPAHGGRRRGGGGAARVAGALPDLAPRGRGRSRAVDPRPARVERRAAGRGPSGLLPRLERAWNGARGAASHGLGGGPRRPRPAAGRPRAAPRAG